jgi:hypothetical protein
MLFSIFKWVIISLTLILLIHHLYTFLINTLTVPKIKDLVNKPNEQYKDIFETMQKKNSSDISSASPPATTVDMTDELTSFLNNIKKTSNDATSFPMADVSSSSDSSGSGYSAY